MNLLKMKRKIFMCVLFMLAIKAVHSYEDENKILNAVREGVEKLLTEDRPSKSFSKAVKTVANIKKDPLGPQDTVCQTCEVVVNRVISYRKSGANKDSMIVYFNKLCTTFMGWESSACQGYVNIEADTVLFIIDNKENLTAKRICAIYLQPQKCVDPDAKKWVIPLPPAPEKKEEILKKENDIDNPLRILHLTDIHYDPLYQPGSNAVCNEPLCCQTGVPNNSKNAAGYWGDYNVCDMPLHSVENLMNHIKAKYIKDIDFIYYTGDIISHKSWATSKEDNIKTIKTILEMFATTFTNKTVYPILGNHEPHPTDFYSPDNVLQSQISTQWIFNVSVTEWSRWLPQSTHDTIRKGGYYSVLVKPGFRIIALNSNFCFTNNLWLMYEDEDPHHQLAWLADELYEAEKKKERVHILSHIPPGELLCHKQWSNQFRKIINRFSHIISAQFNGHTHVDEWRVFYDEENSNEVINVAFNGASFTTFIGYNPNFRIYQVNPSNAMVMDYDQYIFNLTKANQNTTPPQWYKQYSFKEAYGIPDLSFSSLGDLLEKMPNNEDLLWKYFRFMVRDSDVKLKEGCDSKCLKKLYCYITAVEANESVNC